MPCFVIAVNCVFPQDNAIFWRRAQHLSSLASQFAAFNAFATFNTFNIFKTYRQVVRFLENRRPGAGT
jgi:hypothetical protein